MESRLKFLLFVLPFEVFREQFMVLGILSQIHGIKTQVLSASIRSVQRAVRSWYNGAHIVTMPPKILEQMYDHILTDKGMEIFEKDWSNVNVGS